MRWLTFFCILLCISIFQSALINWINIGTSVPDLYFPLVVFYSFLTDFKRNTIANWFAGLSKDLFSEGHFGLNSVFFVAAGFLLWSISIKYIVHNGKNECDYNLRNQMS